MQPKLLRFALVTVSVIFLSFLTINALAQSTATITTDAPDYAPRSTAIFTGSGFAADEIVTLKVKNLSYPCGTVLPDSSYTPWTVQAGPDGSFVTPWIVCDCPGDSLKLIAKGQTSGLIAVAYFTDASNASGGDGTMVVSPVAACEGSTNTFTFTFASPNGADFNAGSQLRFTVPSGWPTPTASNITVTNIDATTVSLTSITGNVVLITMTSPAKKGFKIVYSSVTVPSAGTPSTFITETRQGSPSGSFATISSSPAVTINATNTVTAGTTTNTCINILMTSITHNTTGATGIGAATGLPAGVTASFASNKITISGTPTAAGTFNYTIPLTGGCGTINATGTIVVNPTNTVSAASSTPTLCINTLLTNITHTTTGATGIGTATGLPAGVNASFASNTITISGTPSVAGTFNYSIPLTGGCGNINATGQIIVTPNNTVTAGTTTNTCINVLMTPTIHTTTGATGIGAATGLPTGVTASFASNKITISGTPTDAGTFNYTIPLTGGCGTINATGTIVVNPTNTVSAASSTPTLCINTLLTNITFTTTGATGIGAATGLPTGVTASFASNTITISGTPTAAGTFNYSIPLTGGCGSITATGQIVVTPNNTVTAGITTTTCINEVMTPITHTTTGATGIGTATGLPAGVTASFASNTITISGTPTAAGTFNYTIPLTGGCGGINATGTIIVPVAPTATIAINGANPICSGATTSIKFSGPSMGVITYNIDGGSPITANLNNGGNFILTTAALTSNTTYNLVSVAYGGNPGCSVSASGSVTVTVNQPPVITQPANIPVNTDPGFCSAVVTYTITATGTTPINYTYSFTGATTGSGNGTGSGSSFNKGVTTVSVTASNVCTPNDTKSFTITVTDDQAPMITKGSIASCYKTVADAEAAAIAATTATDLCPGTVTLSASTSGTCNAVITVTATDASNNSSTTTYNTKILTTAPVVPGDGSSSVECVSAATTPTPPAVTDACGAAVTPDLTSTVDSPDPLTCEGTRTYTYTYTDCAGNSSVWKYVYTIQHVTHPVVPSDGSSTVSCAAQATDPGAPSGVTDVCGHPLIGALINTSSVPDCNGSITYTYRFTDCAGLSTDWNYTYHVVYSGGLTAPANGESTVSCPAASQVAPTTTDITDACGRTVHAVLVNHDAAPSCNGDVEWHYTYTACDGTTTANWTYTYHVVYSGGLTAPSDDESTVSCPAASQVAPATTDITDACGRTVHAVLVNHDAAPSCNGDVEWHYTYTACDGTTTANWTYTYHVVYSGGLTAPVNGESTVSCPAASQVAPTTTDITDACGRTVHAVLVGHDAAPACNGDVVWHYTYTACDGTTTANWTYTYHVVYSGGLTAPANGESTVSCPAASQVAPTTTDITDACGRTVHAVLVSHDAAPSCNGDVVWHYTYTACDGTTTANWTYTYHVVRNDFVMPMNQGSTVQCVGDATLPGHPSINDNCGNAITPTGPAINTVFNGCSGTKTYTWTYQDCAGHSHNWVYTYTIADNIKPVISNLKSNATRLFDFNETNYTVQGTEFDETATDNCNLVSMIYTLSGATTGGGISTSTSLAGVDLNFGITTVTWTATDACGNTQTNSFTVTVNKRPTTLVYTGDGVEQYSDQQSLTATLTDQTNGQPISGKTVTFTIGTQSVSATTNASGVASTTLVLTQDPALTYKVATSFAVDATYLGSSDLDNFDITQEDACANYNGDLFVNSSSATGGTATVNLKLALTDKADGFRGDISNAIVKFSVTDGNTTTAYTAALVAGSLSADKTLAWFGASFTANLGTSLSKTYDITWTIAGYYQSDASCSDASAEVTVSAPAADFITGGGYVILDNTVTGKYAGDVGSKNNFGFSVKWNKSLSNIQGGGINSIIRKGTHQYQIKGTKVTALSVTPATGTAPATAAFTCNAVVNDIVNNVVLSSEGNCTAIVEITDVCEPGSGMSTSSDLIAITVKDKNGVVIYSNHWVSTKTVKVPLNGGNLQIHSGGATGAPKCYTTGIVTTVAAREPETMATIKKFDLKAFPNPSESQFTLKIESDNTKDQINIKVTDMFGRTIQTYTNLSAGQTLHIGSNYKVGIYFIEMMQGNMHKQLKLIKQ